MRAFYTDRSGLKADLCLFFDMHNTRLRIRRGYETVFEQVFPSWDDACNALKRHGSDWTNDITGKPIA